MRHRGLKIDRHGDGFATVTAPTHAWLQLGVFQGVQDQARAAVNDRTPAGRKPRSMTLHHSEMRTVRDLTRHLGTDRRFKRDGPMGRTQRSPDRGSLTP